MTRTPFNLLFTLATLLAISVPSPAQGQEKEKVGNKDVAAREVLVKYREGAANQHERLKTAVDADESEAVGSGNVFRIRSKSKKVAELLTQLAKDPDVELVEPNYIVYASAVPNDTYFSLLWGLQNTGQTIGGQVGYANSDIQAAKAWDITTGSTSYVVGIVDTGVNYNHADLAANMWKAPSSFTVTVGGTAITCAAGTRGFNAIKKTCDPLDDNDHGTHVAGTIGAVANNAAGVAGINWKTSIIGLKFLDAAGSGFTSNAINAIDFATQLKSLGLANVRVLNNSWGGGGFSQLLLDAINRANSSDILFVAAAGNEGTNNDSVPSYPANYAAGNVISVAATDNRDALASFSNYGATTVDLSAPGVYIASTVRSGYAYMSGTSMATPHVSGAAALILSSCTLNTAALKLVILNSVDFVSALTGKTVTGGRLNVYRALTSCGSPPTPSFSLAASPSARTVTAGTATTSTITVTALNGFTGTVNLTTGTLPAGVTASFAPSSISTSGSSTLTLSTSSSTPTGTHSITVRGTSGSLTQTTVITLTVNAPVPPSFSLSVSPSSLTVNRGARATFTVTVTGSGGFSGPVTLTVSNLPTSSTASFTVNPVNGSGTSQLVVQTTSSTKTGTKTLIVTGSSPGIASKSATASLRVR